MTSGFWFKFCSGGPEHGHPGGPPVYTYMYIYIYIHIPVHIYIPTYTYIHAIPTYISFPYIYIIHQCFYPLHFLSVIHSFEMRCFFCPYFFR